MRSLLLSPYLWKTVVKRERNPVTHTSTKGFDCALLALTCFDTDIENVCLAGKCHVS